jgi:hypothetical protein
VGLSDIAGQIVTLFGWVARAALIMCSVYVIGLIVPWFELTLGEFAKLSTTLPLERNH